jgi:putative transcriptional regulator
MKRDSSYAVGVSSQGTADGIRPYRAPLERVIIEIMGDSLRGQFLIAARHLRDPNFYKSVVLIVEHNDGGAMGVVINRPSGVTLANALKKHFELPDNGELVYVGGPVEQNALFILHNAEDLALAETPILPGLFAGSSPEIFEKIMERATETDSDLRFRVFFGCAGWAPEQLEGELSRNDWLQVPADAELALSPDPYVLWDELLSLHRQRNPLVPDVQGDPECN